ncbi:MAG: ABC transporter ATP-binding protein [Oscillospiraceae bacterium]|nr:MAG: ABC transporter ATP-binding protein [Oscillospiraceae bacterium]
MKHMTNSLKNIILLIKPYWKYGKTYIILSIIMSVVVAPVNALASVFFTQSVIDAVAHEVSFFEVIIIILRFLFVLLFTLLIQNTFDIFYKEKKSTEIQLNLNQDIYRQILSTDYKYFDDPEFYNNYTLTVNEYSNKSREAVELIINILKSLSTIISMGSVIIVLGPWLVVITVIEMIITVFIETQKNNVNIDKRMKSLAFDRKLGYVHRVFYQREYAADIKVTKLKNYLFALYRESGKSKIGIIKAYAGVLFRWLFTQNCIGIVYNASIMIYISYGLLVSKKIIGVGKFMSLITANTQLMQSMYGVFGLFSQANNLSLYAEKIKLFFESESSIENSIKGDDELGLVFPFKLELNNVSFHYPNSNFGINNISFSIDPGEKVAIVGENGAGKTTITKLIMRLYDPDKGGIFINDKSICDYNLSKLREKIGIAFQATNVYALSLADNLNLYRENSDAELLNTIKELDFDNIFDKSRGDLRIELTKEFEQNGLMLSNGEIQKIGIARILNNNFGLLILDEPSSSLDPIAEYKLTNILYSQANKTTTILIAHRLSMVRGADCIYVLKDGEICESGTHDELMKKRGMYYEMFIKQSENYHIYPQET